MSSLKNAIKSFICLLQDQVLQLHMLCKTNAEHAQEIKKPPLAGSCEN